MDEIEWWEFDTPAELAEQAVGDIGFVIDSAIEAHGGARIALPGRDGPQDLYRALLGAKSIAWPKVTLLPTHESLSGPSNADALQALFGGKGAFLVPLLDGEPGDGQQVARRADARLGEFRWPLDLVLLTVGNEGQVAGIVPASMESAVSGPRGRRVVGTGEGVTLTAAAIASARAVMLILTGPEQRRVVEQAIKDGPLSGAPIGRVLAAIDSPLDIFWSA
jgi:6-phosphogluconolactonase